MTVVRYVLGVMLLLVIAGCSSQRVAPAVTDLSTRQNEEGQMFNISSPAFKAGTTIPVKYSCKGDDISPPLEWSNAPDGTQSFALIFDDPDAPAGTWVHWVVFNLSFETQALAENVVLPPDTRTGKNSWGKMEYGAPCPPSGTHRYFFKLYALDEAFSLAESVTKADLLSAMEGHILAQAELMGTFSR